jgi:hypothetical protein
MLEISKINLSMNDDYDEINDSITMRERRAQTNGQPFDLYLELLIVTDPTIYFDHQIYTQTNNTDLVFIEMQAYFAHYVVGVNMQCC